MAHIAYIPVKDNQCAITRANCAKRTKNDRYEMRVYSNPTPFTVSVFDIGEGECIFIKEYQSVYKGRK